MNQQNEFRSPPTQAEITMAAIGAIRSRLPHGWVLDVFEEPLGSEPGPDAILELEGPNGELGRIVVQAKRLLEARDVPMIKDRISDAVGGRFGPVLPMIVTRYLNPRVRSRLEAEDLAYADATGNIFLSLTKPALFLRDVGADRDPWRGPGRPRGSFKGSIAARVVRALVDFAPPMTVPELIRRSEVSTGAGYRMVEFLEREGLIEHRRRGPITAVDWRTILEQWAEDYPLDLEKDPVRMLEPRGIQSVLKKLGSLEVNGRYALTGSAAAAFFERYAQTRLIQIYAERPRDLAEQLELRPVESGANVLLLPPRDDVVFMRSAKRDGLQVAAPSQVAADLLNGPGRSPGEGNALLDWMQRNESLWRD